MLLVTFLQSHIVIARLCSVLYRYLETFCVANNRSTQSHRHCEIYHYCEIPLYSGIREEQFCTITPGNGSLVVLLHLEGYHLEVLPLNCIIAIPNEAVKILFRLGREDKTG